MRKCKVFHWGIGLILVIGFMIGMSSVADAESGGDQLAASTAVVNTSQITQYGITWTFDREYPTGQFANGDYWVIGPVTITNITPGFDGTYNGWEVNPVFEGPQGLDARAGEFDAALIPSFPYVANPNESVVKAISTDLDNDNCRPCLKTAAILTVLAEVPPGDGADVFRPPYVGQEKPFYYVEDLRTDLLPTYDPVADTPSLEWVEERFSPVQLDHKGGRTGRCLHPEDHMPDYGSNIAQDNDDGALRLMLNDPIEEKMPALIAYIQYGIDLYHMVLLGQTWPSGGGHRPGQKLPLTFASILLDDEEMKDVIRSATFFHEDVGVYRSETTGIALFGFHDTYWTERNYWSVLETGSGFKSHADPYGLIDGGKEPGGSYQFCCISQPWKGSALALHLMPVMKTVWDNQVFFDYVDRWVNQGAWSQPDTCAPYDGNPSNYGVTYGPDGNGGCIKDTDPSDGIGRFPDNHGINVDGGYRYSYFQKAMWEAYRYATGPDPTFEDVPLSHWAYDAIETLYQAGYVSGCSSQPLLFCPEDMMTRAESAVFVERGIHGAEYTPQQPGEVLFADVPLGEWFAKWSHGLWEDGYTSGCGTDPLIYCPQQQHNRAEAAVFFLRMLNGATYEPPPAQGLFADVDVNAWEAKWVEAAYQAGLIDPCETMPELRYCGEDPLSRAMAATIMVRAKGLE
jgi:hypothetical protein